MTNEITMPHIIHVNCAAVTFNKYWISKNRFLKHTLIKIIVFYNKFTPWNVPISREIFLLLNLIKFNIAYFIFKNTFICKIRKIVFIKNSLLNYTLVTK